MRKRVILRPREAATMLGLLLALPLILYCSSENPDLYGVHSAAPQVQAEDSGRRIPRPAMLWWTVQDDVAWRHRVTVAMVIENTSNHLLVVQTTAPESEGLQHWGYFGVTWAEMDSGVWLDNSLPVQRPRTSTGGTWQ